MKIWRVISLLFLGVLASGQAAAELSANLGFASDYYYRGFFQASSSASAGIDFQKNGFYAGAWTADVGQGLEVDGYLGFTGEIGDVSYGVGFTGYYYTQDFDDTYEEINLSTGYGFATLDVAIGEYGNFGNGTQEYAYYALTLEKNGLYGKYAGFSKDFAGEYLEFGYATELADIDLGLSLIFGNEELLGNADEAVVITLGKTFEIN